MWVTVCVRSQLRVVFTFLTLSQACSLWATYSGKCATSCPLLFVILVDTNIKFQPRFGVTTDILLASLPSAVPLATSDHDFQHALRQFAAEYDEIRMRFSTSNSKVMTFSQWKVVVSLRRRRERLLQGEFRYFVDLSDKDCEIYCCNVDVLYLGGGGSKNQSPDPDLWTWGLSSAQNLNSVHKSGQY